MLPEILDIVPEHVAEPVRRPRWRERVAACCRDALLSLLLNGAVVVGLVRVGFPLRSNTSPNAISVELVPRMPGSDARHAVSVPGPGGSSPAAQAKIAEAEHAQSTSEATKEPQSPSPGLQAEAKPAADQPATPEPSAEPARPQPSTASAENGPAATPAAIPPPPEHPDADSRPHLVEAPSAPPTTEPAPEARTAPEAPERTRPEAAAPAAQPPSPTAAATETVSPAQRPVESATQGDDTVSTPAPPPEAPKPLTAEERKQAANTATLAAMLPFGGGIGGNPFTAQSPIAGQGASTAYRGQIYANFNKAQDIIADAKARHLKGQAVVAFTIDDRGNIASLGIAVSSKNPEVDQAALELIRRAAPFPPPPAGAQRSFAPAIGLGLDE